MASLNFLTTTTDDYGPHDESCASNTTLESAHTSFVDDRVATVMVDGNTIVINNDGGAQGADDVPVLHEHAEQAQVYQEMHIDYSEPLNDYLETPWHPSSAEDTQVNMDSLPITVGATEALEGYTDILADQAVANSVDGLLAEEVAALNDAVVAADGVDGVSLGQAVQGGRLHATHFTVNEDTPVPTGSMQQEYLTNGDIFVLRAHGYTLIARVRAVAVESTVYLHFTLVFLGGQNRSLDAFAGHDHLAYDLGFVFGGYNDPGASAFPSDLGAVFGDVQHVADDVFGPAHEDGGIFESDLGFVFNP